MGLWCLSLSLSFYLEKLAWSGVTLGSLGDTKRRKTIKPRGGESYDWTGPGLALYGGMRKGVVVRLVEYSAVWEHGSGVCGEGQEVVGRWSRELAAWLCGVDWKRLGPGSWTSTWSLPVWACSLGTHLGSQPWDPDPVSPSVCLSFPCCEGTGHSGLLCSDLADLWRDLGPGREPHSPWCSQLRPCLGLSGLARAPWLA